MNVKLVAQVISCSQPQHPVLTHAQLDIGRTLQIADAAAATLHAQFARVHRILNVPIPLVTQDIFRKEQPGVCLAILLVQLVRVVATINVPLANQDTFFKNHQHARPVIFIAQNARVLPTHSVLRAKKIIFSSRRLQTQHALVVVRMDTGRIVTTEFVKDAIAFARNVQDQIVMSVPFAIQTIIFSQHLQIPHVLILVPNLDIGLTLQPKLVRYVIVFARNVQDQIAISAPLANQGISCKDLLVRAVILFAQNVRVLSTLNAPHATQIIISSHHL